MDRLRCWMQKLQALASGSSCHQGTWSRLLLVQVHHRQQGSSRHRGSWRRLEDAERRQLVRVIRQMGQVPGLVHLESVRQACHWVQEPGFGRPESVRRACHSGRE